MKTDTAIHAYEPEAPMALPFPALRRLLFGVAVGAVALFVIWASMGTMAQPAPIPGPAEDGWQRYEAPAFAFSYPAEWSVSAPTETEAAYRLAPQGTDAGTHVAISVLPEMTTDLARIERMGVAYVERNEAVTRHYLRIMPRMRLDDRVAARVRFTADLASGERVEGLWVGVPQADGQVLSFVLNVYPDAYYNGVHHTFRRLLSSVTLGG